MCVAELNVTLLPCGHRWYHLVERCTPYHDLSNCSEKLGLRGWETKRDFCPWCSGWGDPHGEFLRLVGGGGRTRGSSAAGFTPPVSRPTSLISVRRESKRLGPAAEMPVMDPIRRISSAQNKRQSLRIEAILPQADFLERNSVTIHHEDPLPATPPPLTHSSSVSTSSSDAPSDKRLPKAARNKSRASSRMGMLRSNFSKCKILSCGL